MRKSNIIKIITLVLIFLITIGNSFVFATNEINYQDFKPSVETGTRIINIISSLLSVLTVLGVAATAVVIALIGFNSILGSANEKAEYKEKMVGVVVAVLMLTCGSLFAKFIISVAESI